MNNFIGSRYRIESEIELKYSPFTNDTIRLNEGYDTLHKRHVLIKSFHLPQNETIQRLTITLWEREI